MAKEKTTTPIEETIEENVDNADLDIIVNELEALSDEQRDKVFDAVGYASTGALGFMAGYLTGKGNPIKTLKKKCGDAVYNAAKKVTDKHEVSEEEEEVEIGEPKETSKKKK